MNRFLQSALDDELSRQQESLNFIASENLVSTNVLNANANVFTNKYAEGYAHKRYYQGCENVDKIEEYTIRKLKALFQAEAANVQPHSGSQANQAVYLALLKPFDTVLAMSLASGGHLTHGFEKNMSGQFYNFVHYEVHPRTLKLDYDEILALAIKHSPKIIIAGASSYSQIIDFARFRKICDSVGAYLMVDMAHIAGLVVAGVHPSPVPYADVVTSTTHKTIRGPRGGFILCRRELLEKINRAVFPGIQGGPLVNIIFAKAVAFDECATPKFIAYGHAIIANSKAMCAEFIKHSVPVVSGMTANHQFTINVKQHYKMTGKAAAERLAKYRIYVNQNVIPFDSEKPYLGSGIRIGVPAITSLGATEVHMKAAAQIIMKILISKNDDVVPEIIRETQSLIELIHQREWK